MKAMRRFIVLLLLGITLAHSTLSPGAEAGRILVSDNDHYLAKQDGTPFFYLGDTAWELFHRLNREEADRYLTDRAEKRFTVIQAVVLAELAGLSEPNAYGALPLDNNDPTRTNEAYFKHVDWIVDKAAEKGLVIGMLPTWGSNWSQPVGKGGIFTPENAATYGEFLGRRYRDKPIIWILGGDRSVENDSQRANLSAMAGGLRKGDGGTHLITFHPPGGQNSSKWFHNEPWLDFNMWQNGHCDLVPVWERIQADFDRKPAKPVMDGEPLYEDHPICFNAKERGTSNAADVRRFLYWDLFSGAHGHTYGNHSIWQMNAPGRQPINGPLNYWFDALDRPGAGQMRHGRALLESRPYFNRIPDQAVLKLKPASGINAGLKHVVATRAADGAYAMVYIPSSRMITVDMTKISGNRAKAWWFNPRTGKANEAGDVATSGEHDFLPPDAGENIDWVLVIDDASKNFAPPGEGTVKR